MSHVEIDHPVDIEPIAAHAETGTLKRLLQRYLYPDAVAGFREQVITLLLAIV